MSIIYKASKYHIFNIACCAINNCKRPIQLEVINKLEDTSLHDRFMFSHDENIQTIEFCSTYGIQIENDIEYLFGIMIKLQINDKLKDITELLFIDNIMTFDNIASLNNAGYKLLESYIFTLSNQHLICDNEYYLSNLTRYLNWLLKINCCSFLASSLTENMLTKY